MGVRAFKMKVRGRKENRSRWSIILSPVQEASRAFLNRLTVAKATQDTRFPGSLLTSLSTSLLAS